MFALFGIFGITGDHGRIELNEFSINSISRFVKIVIGTVCNLYQTCSFEVFELEYWDESVLIAIFQIFGLSGIYNKEQNDKVPIWMSVKGSKLSVEILLAEIEPLVGERWRVCVARIFKTDATFWQFLFGTFWPHFVLWRFDALSKSK